MNGASVELTINLIGDVICIVVDDGTDFIETELSKKEIHVLVAILGNMAQMMPNLRLEGTPTPGDILAELQSKGELKEGSE